jgi:hypothetical protein
MSRLVQASAIPVQIVRRGLILAGMLLLLLQVAVAIPRRAAIYADAYWGVDDSPMREARRLGLKEAIIFIEGHPWEALQTKLHSLGLIMGDAYRLMFTVTPQGLDQVLGEMGYHGEKQWGAQVDRNELEVRALNWNRIYLAAGNPPVNPWAETGRYTYFSNGAVYLDPSHRSPNIILARDLGDHNHALLEQYPDRKAYRFAWDEPAGRFRLLPMVK